MDDKIIDEREGDESWVGVEENKIINYEGIFLIKIKYGEMNEGEEDGVIVKEDLGEKRKKIGEGRKLFKEN